MTSDAKIGLLLGLIFIFVVAFIINGLPNLKPQSTRAEVATNMVPLDNQSIGIADQAQERAAQDWKGLTEEQEPQAQVATETPVAEQPVVVAELPAQEPQPANSPEVRFESPLPKIENLLERITAGLQSQREQTSTVSMDVPTPAGVEQPVAAERQPAVQAVQPKPQETVASSMERSKPAATTPARPERTYVVGEGESLSTVAKKVYGLEEGNKIANVERIFQANRDILPSVDQVKSGQKLVIPPLPKTTTVNPNKPSDVLPADLFERLETLKRPMAQTQTQAPAASTPATNVQTRWYTVQDGDNLWRIASSQLGAGARYDEIAKLNADLLKDPSKVDPGTKIRLPLK
jgi:nucleoid-associated protein YgaU